MRDRGISGRMVMHPPGGSPRSESRITPARRRAGYTSFRRARSRIHAPRRASSPLKPCDGCISPAMSRVMISTGFRWSVSLKSATGRFREFLENTVWTWRNTCARKGLRYGAFRAMALSVHQVRVTVAAFIEHSRPGHGTAKRSVRHGLLRANRPKGRDAELRGYRGAIRHARRAASHSGCAQTTAASGKDGGFCAFCRPRDGNRSNGNSTETEPCVT